MKNEKEKKTGDDDTNDEKSSTESFNSYFVLSLFVKMRNHFKIKIPSIDRFVLRGQSDKRTQETLFRRRNDESKL